MKLFISSLFFTVLGILISINTSAQNNEWFEIGSTWTYNYEASLEWPVSTYEARFAITEETEFAGQLCKKMEVVFPDENPFPCMNVQPPYYLYESNDSIFYASEYTTEFRLLYDFGAEVGDSWQVEVPWQTWNTSTTYLATVADVSTVVIDGQELRTLHIDYQYISGSQDFSINTFGTVEIIEKLGAPTPFFIPYTETSLCEGSINVHLRCFSSPGLVYLNPNYESCAVSIAQINNALQPDIFPNPATDYIRVENSNAQIFSVKLFNTLGQVVYTAKIASSQIYIPLHGLKSGCYFIEVQTGTGLAREALVVE